MPRGLYRPHELRRRVFRGTEALDSGLLTPAQLRSRAWLRIRHDAYADSRLDRDHRLLCHAVGLWLPPHAAIAGPSAAYLLGVTHAAKFSDDVHVVTPPEHRLPALRGLRIHHSLIEQSEIGAADGIACTDPARTAWDLANWLDLARAVGIIDGLLRLGLIDPMSLRKLADSRVGRRGAKKAATAFGLADGRAESPPESHLRVWLVLAGLPPPVPQHPVVMPDGKTYRLDLAWPEYRVAIEYDGHWHGAPEQLHADRRRLNQLVGAGWIVLHVTSQRLYRDFEGVLREASTALQGRS